MARWNTPGTPRKRPAVITGVSDLSNQTRDTQPAELILIEQSGTKREIPQPSAVNGIKEAEEAIHRHGRHLRQVKVVSHHKAIARWKSDEVGWRRVA
jgi:hypothetical protein